MHEVIREALGPGASRVAVPAAALAGRKESMIVDEQIWGNRLRAGQEPWFILLEFLTVAEYYWRADEHTLFSPEEGMQRAHKFNYKPHTRLHLRILLFNEQDAVSLADGDEDSHVAWNSWCSKMEGRYAHIEPNNFNYLRDGETFEEFGDFARAIDMLREAVVAETGKRWTSRFLFPFGKHAIYEDVGIKPTGELDRNYIYFGHTGELLYLMICRCGLREELAAQFASFFARTDLCDLLLSKLLPSGANGRANRGGGYLPYKHHRVYDELGEDWLHVLKLGGLSWRDKLAHLATLAALHLMRYQLLVSREVLRQGAEPTMVCEIISPQRTQLRRLSVRSLETNKGLSTQGVEAYLEAIEGSAKWQEAAQAEDGGALGAKLLEEVVAWRPKDRTDSRSADALMKEFREAVLKRHKQRSAGMQVTCGRRIGLVSRRGTNRYRYAPNDALLRTLVLANVAEHMEFNAFLARLYKRYGIVIGQVEASQVLKRENYDGKALQENARRLESRLRSLGLVRRLSDACAYVINPYYERAKGYDKDQHITAAQLA